MSGVTSVWVGQTDLPQCASNSTLAVRSSFIHVEKKQDEEDRIFDSWIMLPLGLLDVRPFISVSTLPRNVAFSGTLSKLVGLGPASFRCV